ncbi:MAG: ABC transporter ATP-binding protein [Roseivirga sp.]|uniref:ABC transporter ATP-binding protein n=1 Tax=Roseivirga sp. TaxID=1964215 RepID=UPI001B0D0B2F|nr:ABC transporter ATP-binding protein [Roseivirga sp.]MBO6660925.1 ABC transporter ATP-binding protein [Roseivirga sp.]MBO6909091.1 ABC transporter ATP-binding protein [Roseivirga sp.]
MSDKILHTASLSVGYKDRTVLSSLNLNLNKGQLTCLLGPNGSGKSTLIRTLAGIQKPLLGMVTLQGKSLREVSPKTLAKQLSLVLTDRVTPGNLTVYGLVSLGRFPYTTWMGSLTGEDKDVIQWALEITGTMQFANRHIGELSDGEKQKVMIARALAQQTDLIILDEPTAHLDSPNRIEIFHLLRELVSSGHRAILISTHDIDTAIANADKLWLVANQSISQGAPEDLVLDGRLEKAFTKEGLSFNYSLGRFEKTINNNGLKVLIKGSSLSAHWTESALRRAGFQPVEHLPQVTIEVLDDGSKRKWILNNQLEITTIEELLTKLNTYENEME